MTKAIECPAEEFIPLPTKSRVDTLSYPDLRARARAACTSAVLLDMNSYEDEPDMEFVQAVTQGTLRRAAQGKEVAVEEANAAMNTPAGALYVDTLLSAFDMEVVRDARRLRNYVTNRLLVESENMDARIRMRALELLGKISDVGLFTERTEITINNRSTVELENTLKEKLRKLMNVDAAEDARVLMPPIERPRDLPVA